MKIDELVDQIYLKLQEQFGIGKVFLPKYRQNRLKDITWPEFILASIDLTQKELASFAGYSSIDNFSEGTRNKYPQFKASKGNSPWKHWLLSLISYRQCSKCGRLLSFNFFTKRNGEKLGIGYECKDCEKVYREENITYQIKYKLLNREATREWMQKYYIDNKSTILSRMETYYQNNKKDFFARAAKRRASKLQATPKWADLGVIKEIYRTCPEGYHVDHVIPLQHPLVCGLHCEFNLQHLSAHENLSKGNKYEP